MNFVPVQAGAGLRRRCNLHINGSIVLPVPASRTERYKPLAGKAKGWCWA